MALDLDRLDSFDKAYQYFIWVNNSKKTCVRTYCGEQAHRNTFVPVAAYFDGGQN